jgi:LysM repeat protein
MNYTFCFLLLFSISNAQTKVHIALPGDDIYKLASKYHLKPKQIAHINGFEKINKSFILYQTIIIPEKYYEIRAEENRSIKEIYHKVLDGESLYSISRKYNLTVFDILESNQNLKRGKPLEPGSTIIIIGSNDNASQISGQLIILNRDEVNKRKDIRVTSSNKIIINNDAFQSQFTKSNIKLILDTLTLDENNSNPIFTRIHNVITNYNDKNYSMELDILGLSELLLYVNSDLLYQNSKDADYNFKKNSLELIDKMLKYNPYDANLFVFSSLIYLWINDLKKANFYCNEALIIDPNNFIGQLINASIFAKKNEWKNAQYEFEKIKTEMLENNILNYNLGEVYFNLIEPEKSNLYFEKINDFNKIKPEIYYKIGKNYIILENIEKGCMYLKKSYIYKYKKGTIEYLRHCR